jgi:hypothetical protein
MSWVSCAEDNEERAMDSAMAYQLMLDRFQPPKPLPQPPSRPIVFKVSPQIDPAAEAARVSNRAREMRDMHVLCLSEMRPKAQRPWL